MIGLELSLSQPWQVGPHRSSTRSARAPTNYLIDIQPIRDGQVSFAGASRAPLRRICTLPFRPSDPRIVRDERKTNRIILEQKRSNKIFEPGENQPRNLVEKSVIKIWSSDAVEHISGVVYNYVVVYRLMLCRGNSSIQIHGRSFVILFLRFFRDYIASRLCPPFSFSDKNSLSSIFLFTIFILVVDLFSLSVLFFSSASHALK